MVWQILYLRLLKQSCTLCEFLLLSWQLNYSFSSSNWRRRLKASFRKIWCFMKLVTNFEARFTLKCYACFYGCKCAKKVVKLQPCVSVAKSDTMLDDKYWEAWNTHGINRRWRYIDVLQNFWGFPCELNYVMLITDGKKWRVQAHMKLVGSLNLRVLTVVSVFVACWNRCRRVLWL